MIPDVGFVVGYFASSIAVTHERAGALTYEDGVAVSAAPTSVAIEAVPVVDPRALDRREEGDRTPESRTFLVLASVDVQGSRASGTGAPSKPDVLIESGVRWIVTSVGDWTRAGYQRVGCAREGE